MSGTDNIDLSKIFDDQSVGAEPVVNDSPKEAKQKKAKTVGADISSTNNDKVVKFLSRHKSTALVRPDGTLLKFSHSMYRTDNENDIALIRGWKGVYGHEIFEGELPQWIRDRQTWERNQTTTLIEDEEYKK